MPGPSYWPVLIAAGGTLVILGLIFDVRANVFITIGGVLVLMTGFGWALEDWREREQILVEEREQGRPDSEPAA